jgi:hypothetical protein
VARVVRTLILGLCHAQVPGLQRRLYPGSGHPPRRVRRKRFCGAFLGFEGPRITRARPPLRECFRNTVGRRDGRTCRNTSGSVVSASGPHCAEDSRDHVAKVSRCTSVVDLQGDPSRRLHANDRGRRWCQIHRCQWARRFRLRTRHFDICGHGIFDRRARRARGPSRISRGRWGVFPMSQAPTSIGQCRACLSRPRIVETRSQACIECLTRRGRRWTALAIRARESPEFRARVREELTPGSRARQMFGAMFGQPMPQAVSRLPRARDCLCAQIQSSDLGVGDPQRDHAQRFVSHERRSARNLSPISTAAC